MLASKQLVQDIEHRPIDDTIIKKTYERIADIRLSEEGQEGLFAFLEKRKPHWRQDN